MNSLKNIYFTDKFKSDIQDESKSIELVSFRLGEYSNDVPRGEANEDGTHTGIKYINYDYMSSSTKLPNGQYVSDSVSPSPTSKAYSLECVYTPESNLLDLYVIPKSSSGVLDEGLFDNRYKILYILYKNKLTDIEDLAFVIYNEDIDTNSPNMELFPLDLSKYNNLITIKIPIKCNISTYMTEDTYHLESSGVKYKNYYKMEEDEYNSMYVDKNSVKRYHYNSISSDLPSIGGITINKYGLKLF